MASKKGIIITIIILAVITAGSFLFWMVPQESQMSIVVSDYENYLDGVKEIHSVLDQTILEDFQKLRDGNMTPEEYFQTADVVSSQVTAKISEFVASKPSSEWQESYINYMQSLQSFNSYVTETKVYAGLIKDGKTEQLDESMKKIQSIKSETERLVKMSDDSRPK